MHSEEEDKLRLRKAQEFLTHCRETENQARIALASAVESTKRAKEKYEDLFTQCEARASARIRAAS
jgi:hypothetical protein